MQPQPQIIVIPQSMLASNSLKTVFTLGDQQPRPTVTRVIKPSIPIAAPSLGMNKTISLKRPLPVSSPQTSGSDDDLKFDPDEFEHKARKRANLDHMTMEEKMQRRKLKNRVAAQNARDKKRVRMEDMELTIKQLQQQNKILARQNQDLLALNRRLMAENQSLKSGSGHCPQTPIKEESKDFLSSPYSPESLPPPSQTPPLSSCEEDDILSSHALPIEAVDTCSVPVNNAAAVAAVAGRRLSVSDRLCEPAEPTKLVLQQQEQSRSQAVERAASAATASSSAPEQLARLLWMCRLLNSSSLSTQESSASLPFKKRTSSWHHPPVVT
jgi:hypothetical protein